MGINGKVKEKTTGKTMLPSADLLKLKYIRLPDGSQ
jgi:hypothetical protein